MDQLAPSAYHDPREVVWKHFVAQSYWDILDRLRADGIAISDIDEIRFNFLKSFNGQHDIDQLCRQADAVAAEFVAVLQERGHPQTAEAVGREIAKLRHSLSRALEGLQQLRQVDRTQSYVVDQTIMIAGRSAEEFAANSDYIRATLELVREGSPEVVACARAAWQRGFVLDGESAAVVRKAATEGWRADEMLAEVLLREQRSGAYPSLQEHEFVPGGTPAENHGAKLRAIEEGYFLLGRLMSSVSLMNDSGVALDARELADACPVAAMLKQAGVALTPARLIAYRQFMLVHATHGLNPGEFTARMASSVRSTFPQALIASFMVRAGKVHAGALTECMQQLDACLAAPSRREFARQLLRSGALYGFGHRIHKRPADAGDDALGGDPRVAFQVAKAREAFPELQERIAALDDFARTIRRMKPALAPNTDFGAAVWFLCFGLAPQVGAGMFSLNRLPGLIAQVINQLDYKANSLRPPLAVNLPYTL
jgi:Citrate synthase, C-terminal domain